MIYVIELKTLEDKIPELIPTVLSRGFKETDDYYIGFFDIIYQIGMSMGYFPLQQKYKYLQINK